MPTSRKKQPLRLFQTNNREGEEKRIQATKKKKEGKAMTKAEIRRIVEKELGVNYDSKIVIDSLAMPGSVFPVSAGTIPGIRFPV